MKAKWVGDPNHDDDGKNTIEAFGVTWEKGKVRDVPAGMEGKVDGNSHFEVQGDSEGKRRAKEEAAEAERSAKAAQKQAEEREKAEAEAAAAREKVAEAESKARAAGAEDQR